MGDVVTPTGAGSTTGDTPGPVERAFLIADVRGYTSFTRERGDAEAARLATRLAEVARDRTKVGVPSATGHATPALKPTASTSE